MPASTRTISVKLPAHLDDALTATARRRRASKSQVIREALEAFATSEKSSVLTAAGDLVGCLAGPRDLSVNPRHMADYGR
jgi:Arc/MetJ-type ribon-helix-helix transcriptional regulator